MIAPLLPPDERQRLAALHQLCILDTPAEERFDRITRIAQRLFNVQIALVSLVDSGRQWFKSRQGLDAPETPRNISFCGHAILADTPLIVPNALHDTRFADNPLVLGAPHIRFYAGVPLRDVTGLNLGTLCIIDDKPRELDAALQHMLRDLGLWVESELNLRALGDALVAQQASEARLRTVVDSVAEGIITLTANGRIQSFNHAAELIFDYGINDVHRLEIGQLMLQPVRDGDAKMSLWAVTNPIQLMAAGSELIGRRRDGSEFALELTVGSVLIGDERVYTAVVRDITRRKHEEDEMRLAREQAERANRAKSEFLSSMSHELRTPLNSVLGYAQLLSYDKSLNHKQLDAVGKINAAGRHLLTLINDVLDLSRIEAGNLQLLIEDVDLAEVVYEARALIEPQAKERGITLQFATLGGLIVLADRTRLRQCILNLLSNAVKYNRNSGSVFLEYGVEAERVQMKVRDTGVGMTPEVQAQLFQPFNRMGQERGQIEGTGIGLVITRRITEMMDGTLSVESTPDKGSIFTLNLPRVQRAPVAIAETQAMSPAAAASRALPPYFLYIEDNIANAMLIAAVVDQVWPSARFVTVATAEEGLQRVRTELPDLIMLDGNLPGMSGEQALLELKRDPRMRTIPVIAITANAAQVDIDAGLAAGFDAYMTKPLDLDRFIATVTRLIDPNIKLRASKVI